MEEEGTNPTEAIHSICKKVADSKLDTKFTQGKRENRKLIFQIFIIIFQQARRNFMQQ